MINKKLESDKVKDETIEKLKEQNADLKSRIEMAEMQSIKEQKPDSNKFTNR